MSFAFDDEPPDEPIEACDEMVEGVRLAALAYAFKDTGAPVVVQLLAGVGIAQHLSVAYSSAQRQSATSVFVFEDWYVSGYGMTSVIDPDWAARILVIRLAGM